MKLTLLAVLLFLGLLRPLAAAEPLEETINFLFDRIAHSDVTFVRNGDPHTPAEAVKHMRAKYERFKPQIKTPEDFIRLAASKSLLSGQPYLVRMKDGQETRLDAWLTAALQKYREHEGAKK